MVENQELQPINQNLQGPRQNTPNQFIDTPNSPLTQRILRNTQRGAKIVLCFILFSIITSYLLLDPPSPSALPPAKLMPAPKQSDQLSFNTFGNLKSTTVVGDEIRPLSESVRKIFNQMIERDQPSVSQLRQLQQMLLLSKAKLQKKHQFHRERSSFFLQKSRFEYLGSLKLEEFNMRGQNDQIRRLNEAKNKQFQELNYHYKFDQIRSEMPFCGVAYATKTRKQYAPEYFLTSVLNQNYSNYKIAIVLDDKKQADLAAWTEAIHYSNSTKVELIVNQEKLGYWQSIKSVINSPCCDNAEVIALFNGNDQFLSFHVFNVFNAVYQKKQANVAYSNFLEFHQQYNQVFKGFSDRYSQKQIAQYQFRQAPIIFGSPLTFRKQLFGFVRDDSVVLPAMDGTEFEIQVALYLSLLQLSCGKIEYIPEYFYLFQGYKFQRNNQELLQQFLQSLKSLQRYRCYKYMRDQK